MTVSMLSVSLSMLLAVGTMATCKDISDVEWTSFKEKHGKVYPNENEEKSRQSVFKENLRKIQEHNNRYAKGLEGFNLKMNHYGDMGNDEFLAKVARYQESSSGTKGNGTQRKGPSKYIEEPTTSSFSLPASVDWRAKGAITPVKDQGTCGACWAFSATGAVEAQLFLKTKKLVSLSEQNLIDCSKDYGNYGCDGGSNNWAYAYIIGNDGIDTETSYPYKGKDGKCQYNPKNSATKVADYYSLPQDETKLAATVASRGPVSCGFKSMPFTFQFYGSGVFYDPKCTAKDLNHSVLVVGYGTTSENKEYWLCKNSWSDQWGEKGYFKLARNRNNQCGIVSGASYPTV